MRKRAQGVMVSSSLIATVHPTERLVWQALAIVALLRRAVTS